MTSHSGDSQQGVRQDSKMAGTVYSTALDIINARLEDRKLLSSEFRHVLYLDECITHSVDDSQMAPNLPLNRYWNILPYDYNRVQTDKIPYLNASHMSLPDRIRGRVFRYIATQGPLPNTTRDFWHMMLTHRVPCAIMLTGIIESGTVKCAPYFPTATGEVMELGDGLTVTCTTVLPHATDPHVIERILQIVEAPPAPAPSHPVPTPVRFTTRHYQFNAWPDHGTPQDGQAILRMCRALAASRGPPEEPGAEQRGAAGQPGAGPEVPEAVVHCSAGIGRTGTFLSIDVMRERLHSLAASGATSRQIAAALDLPTLVHELRQQRMYSVQTYDQYVFIYKVLREELQSALTLAQAEAQTQAQAAGDVKKANGSNGCQ